MHSVGVKAIFDTRPGSGYLDTVDAYQFPARYLATATAAVGDWILHYEPSREGGRRAYVAAARVVAVDADAAKPGQFLARLRDYLPFDEPVSLRGPEGYREQSLRDVARPADVGRTLQGRSVRSISEHDFAAIASAGLADTLNPRNARRLDLERADESLRGALAEPFAPRAMERVLSSRIVRDASFRRGVLAAYGDTCAATRLRIVNGGGRAEAQAAHIIPVAEGGPDVVQNGIALSATAHWLFDRHLISIGEDWRLLVSHNKVPAPLRGLFTPGTELLRLPADRSLWPHQAFAAHHRERYLAG